MKLTTWWIISVIWLLFFAIATVFVVLLGSAADFRLMSFVVLSIVFMIILLLQLFLLFFLKK
ncbi:hypothetical protein [Liquorilactobacillus uvarum]|uniref:Uncharacterized protein n=1 Tax=Liquorilactobacillus uvarum DSM 19971 TaxID=1423812 RepID=A0A0R1PZL4_9LACO|nr:hypothetical protein [Liquorilactobacillus uvarum]KRL37873.1 hypothetical protein FD20_GL002411 [Liquorilactobacillus uvarum DSM 19971]